jgi:predicted nucleic acid-binding Zn ribbon protein
VIYEYHCEKCATVFDVTATAAEKAAGVEPVCVTVDGRVVQTGGKLGERTIREALKTR